jgi:alcohol dehydrogenase class IV
VLSFTYTALPGRVLFGVGALSRLPEEVDRLGAKRLLIVVDGAKKALAEEIGQQLGDRFAGTFSHLTAHVPIETALTVRQIAREASATCVVTVGGGSTTGLGKAIALESDISIIAIPTTYAGSEMTPVYGITSEGQKRVGRNARVLPKVVIYDPALTTSLPASVTGPSGMNAIAHCVEALYSKEANPITSLMAEEGIRALVQGLPKAVRNPEDLEGRTQALYGAYLAGAALAVTGMAIHHRICHVLGGTYGLAHGEVNSVILPHAITFNAHAAPEAIARVARAAGVNDAAAGLFDFAAAIGAPTSLAGLGMQKSDLDGAAKLSIESPLWNPRPADFDAVRALLDDAYHGRRPTIT